MPGSQERKTKPRLTCSAPLASLSPLRLRPLPGRRRPTTGKLPWLRLESDRSSCAGGWAVALLWAAGGPGTPAHRLCPICTLHSLGHIPLWDSPKRPSLCRTSCTTTLVGPPTLPLSLSPGPRTCCCCALDSCSWGGGAADPSGASRAGGGARAPPGPGAGSSWPLERCAAQAGGPAGGEGRGFTG